MQVLDWSSGDALSPRGKSKGEDAGWGALPWGVRGCWAPALWGSPGPQDQVLAAAGSFSERAVVPRQGVLQNSLGRRLRATPLSLPLRAFLAVWVWGRADAPRARAGTSSCACGMWSEPGGPKPGHLPDLAGCTEVISLHEKMSSDLSGPRAWSMKCPL